MDAADDKGIGAGDDIVGEIDVSVGFSSVCFDELQGMG